MSALQLQFGNSDVIISKILQDINKLRPIAHDYQKDIVPFAIKIQNCVAAVSAIGCDEYLNGMTLVSTVLSKLPTVLISKWTDYSFPLIKLNSKPKFILLSEFLSLEAQKVTQCNINLPNIIQSWTVKNNINHTTKPKSQTVLFNYNDNKDVNSDLCGFCKLSEHALPDCSKFKKALRKARWSYVKRSRVCFKCLSARHRRSTCPAAVCDVTACGQPHHRLLHYVPTATAEEVVAPSTVTQSGSEPIEVVTHVKTNGNEWSVRLKVVPVMIHGPNGEFRASALLDDGSTVSLISASLAARAGLRGRTQTMRVRGAWDKNELVCAAELVDLIVSNKLGEKFNISARSVNELSLPEQGSLNFKCETYDHLRDIKDDLCFASLKPDLLIGQDNYHLLLPLDTLGGKPGEPCATRTPLGWCLHGRVPSTQAQHAALCMSDVAPVVVSATDELHDEVRRYFALESMGASPSKPRQNAEDERAWKRLEQTSTLLDGRCLPQATLGDSAVKFKMGEQNDGDRTLGLIWHTTDDTLRFDMTFKKIPKEIIDGERKPSKREMLRVVMSIFDVYGFLSPFTINGKILLQETWQLNIDWDDLISDEIFIKWKKWICLLKSLGDIKLPRYYQSVMSAIGTEKHQLSAIDLVDPTSATSSATPVADNTSATLLPSTTFNQTVVNRNGYRELEMHVFCDASVKAFCAVAYWRWIDHDANIRVAFIASKCRVAGNKPITVPRLELQAAVLASRLAETITNEHKMKAKPGRNLGKQLVSISLLYDIC
ncbi:hypothetical protein B5X24_HaOG210397 [Helicoverpa armigera]|uniref:Peptidase aspartic putative domain-containing protein n=1 Tax=Helicoverpa armigera TaxID=29058 RepID=A0A2W1BC83_HELAM|nr:hypothetical protein B5X24_HaOG210397 [Helicoverpa armigera]